MMNKKILRNDIILIVSLLAIAITFLIIVLANRKSDNLIAKVYVRNEVVETIDLSNKEEKDYIIQGAKGILTIHTKDGKIAVIESNCPHQDCVHMGYVGESNHPIICTYNEVSIIIESSSDMDTRVG